MRAHVDADVAIIGAGCAGLSLAARLADAGPEVGRVVVVDGRTAFARDRTWCFRNVHAQPFPPAVTHPWSRWRIVAPDGADVVRTSRRYAYQHVPADAFYAEALARIARAPHVELRLGEHVGALTDEHGGVRLQTTRDALRAAHVYDSRALHASAVTRAAPSDGPRTTVAARLVQAFAGAVVHADRPAFDAGAATAAICRRGVPAGRGVAE